MIPNEYKEALKALKGQACAATAQLANQKRVELADTQKRMALYERETKVIYRLLMASTDETLTIDILDEERLAKELGFA